MGINMKPFDLEKALVGEPVALRGGKKAYVVADLRELFRKDTYFPRCLIGVSATEGNEQEFCEILRWKPDGKYFERIKESNSDIVGMWEEPKLTTEELMEKAFQEKLVLVNNALQPFCEGYKVVGKTLNNEYILQDLDDSCLQFLYIFNKDLEWSIKN